MIMLGLYTVEPNLLAHARLVTTDFGVTCFAFGTMYFLWRTTRLLRLGNLCGLAGFFVLAAIGLVILIACADVGSLLLSRAVQRQKEITIRASLGAGLWRIVRQLLSESLVLAVLGSLAGIVVARLLLELLTKQLAALPIVLPHLQRVALNERVLAFNIVLCLLIAILCSLAPILLAVRTDLQAVLRSGQAAAGPRGSSNHRAF